MASFSRRIPNNEIKSFPCFLELVLGKLNLLYCPLCVIGCSKTHTLSTGTWLESLRVDTAFREVGQVSNESNPYFA